MVVMRTQRPLGQQMGPQMGPQQMQQQQQMMQQRGQWNPQAQQQPPQQQMGPTGSSVLRNRLEQKAQQQQQQQQQQQGDNPTLKTLLNHPPSNMNPTSGGGIMQSGSPQQPGVRPGMTPVLAQQLARPPNPAASGSQMTQQAGQPMMQGGPRTRGVIWEGELQWKENVKAADGKPVSSGNKTIHTVRCQAKASKDAGQGNSEVKFQNWPQTLILQLIPKDLAQTIGSHFFEGSGSVLFRPEPSESLDALTKTLSSGYAGCVHFTGIGAAQCDIKVLILLYSNDKKAYLGFIPNDQTSFVERIRTVIQRQKMGQQQQQPQPGQRSMGPGGPGGGMQMGMQMQQGQAMM